MQTCLMQHTMHAGTRYPVQFNLLGTPAGVTKRKEDVSVHLKTCAGYVCDTESLIAILI